MKGLFTISKSQRHVSSIACDQAHEQNNKDIKTEGDAIGIFGSPTALLTVAAPDMMKILEPFILMPGDDNVTTILSRFMVTNS